MYEDYGQLFPGILFDSNGIFIKGKHFMLCGEYYWDTVMTEEQREAFTRIRNYPNRKLMIAKASRDIYLPGESHKCGIVAVSDYCKT